jgi:hypothetical protein
MMTVLALPRDEAASSAEPDFDRPLLLGTGRRGRFAAKAAADDVEKTTDHRFAHDVAQMAGRSHQGNWQHQHRIVQ